MVLEGTNLSRLILDHTSTEKTAGEKTSKKPCIADVKKISEGLSKIANLPYKEEVYNSVQEIMKIASECIGELTESFESVQARNSDLEKVAEIRILIDEMVKVGHVDEYNIDEKVAELMEKDASQLSIVKEAMEMLKGGKEGNVFFDETEKTAGSTGSKKGMFGDILPD